MSDSLFSPSWYRVAELKPRLRQHAEIHRHVYRGQVWYVLQDHASGRFHRFTPAANLIIGLMDGKRTFDEIWKYACERLGDDAPSQDEVIRLVTRLYSADVLLSGVPPDMNELVRRAAKQKRQHKLSYFKNPMAVKFPLFDPDNFLQRTMPFVRPLFSWAFGLVWLLVVIGALVQIALNWGPLTDNITDTVLAAENLLLLFFLFPIVKALHELGHAYAARIFGGEVHEMGVMLLVLMPIPYVDASSSSAFRSASQRMLVGAAGMLVEIFLAALAAYVWVLVEPGSVRVIAYNVMLIAGVSTLLFNLNPLLRFDGYYILIDLLQIPDLGSRANRYVGYLVESKVIKNKGLIDPSSAPGEPFWFVLYAVLAFLYRLLIIVTIITFVASKYFILGTILALWAFFSMVIKPVGKQVKSLFFSSRFIRNRERAVGFAVTVLAVTVLPVSLIPFPLWTNAEGVVWVPEESWVRVETDGFVTRVPVASGAAVKRGDALLEVEEPVLAARVRTVEARLRELRTRYSAIAQRDRVAAANVREEVQLVEEQLRDVRAKQQRMVLVSQADGMLLLNDTPEDMTGRFMGRGEPVGYIIEDRPVVVRTVVPQADVDLVRSRTLRVQALLAEKLDDPLGARVLREVPGATNTLPSKALSLEGGGLFALDPRSPEAPETLDNLFVFDVELDPEIRPGQLGGRVYLRFEHDSEPLIYRWYRQARRLFLRQFNV